MSLTCGAPMNVRPLIVRELRAEARRPNTYWLRSLAAALLTALFVWSTWNFQGGGALGPMLFEALSNGLLLAVLVIVSAITADTISREKREGTLGLLFLTPLRANDIVVGKSLLHGLRAGTLFIAVVPIVGLPFLLGGIPLSSLVTFSCGLPATVLIAVAAGIVASVRSREWIESIVWAELFCAAFCFVFIFLQFVILGIAHRIWAFRRPPTWLLNWWAIAAPASVLFAILVLGLALIYAGRRLRMTWQDESSETESWWVKLFSTSQFWRTAFHWDTKKARDRNPIAWLQEYNWSSRLTKWGWCILLFLAQWRLLLGWRQFMDYQMNLYWLVAIGIAFSAAASFRRERQTGALELLLVTPISAGQLILGRLQGVWIHFFPAIAILACVWIMGPQLLSLPLRYSFYLLGAYFCIPIIGFYCSLLTPNVLVAWLVTLLFAQGLPYAFTETFRFDIGRRNIPFAFFAIQATFATVAGILLYENLVKRRFVLRS
jgi:ABC-type transport system involved in multi-copper enzyme maturation permease subunit